MTIGLLIACTASPGDSLTARAMELTAVTFNTGTAPEMAHDNPPDDGYSSTHAERSDAWYGDGLAWLDAVEATRDFLADTNAQVVAFQEIFWAGDCGAIPEDQHIDFYCSGYEEGDPTVAQYVLGDGWQVACHPGKPDKCAAVHSDFGRFAGCEGDFCLEGLDGYTIDGCSNGARIGRGSIELAEGGQLTLVSVHGSSGIATDDQDCRTAQVEQVFVDLGDGQPGANGDVNLVLGDLNTDPARWADFDPSAARWRDFVGGDQAFQFVTRVGEDVTPTYGGIANIDHVISDGLVGDCVSVGVDPGTTEVIDAVYFDHVPAVCALELR